MVAFGSVALEARYGLHELDNGAKPAVLDLLSRDNCDDRRCFLNRGFGSGSRDDPVAGFQREFLTKAKRVGIDLLLAVAFFRVVLQTGRGKIV